MIDGTVRKGWSALVRGGSSRGDYGDQSGPVQILTSQGFKAARILAERDGLMFAEAVKPAAA